MFNFQVLIQICLLCLCIWKSTQHVAGEVIPPNPSHVQSSSSDSKNSAGHAGEEEFSHSTKLELPSAFSDENDEDITSAAGFGGEFSNYLPKLRPSYMMNIYPKGSVFDESPAPKQMAAIRTTRIKRTPTGFTARGFHEGAFDRDFGHFSPVKRTHKRKPEADSSGFYGDTFSNGFGEFETMKRLAPQMSELELAEVLKRKPMGASGFHSDTFSNGFGDFDTMKRHYPYNNWADKVKKNQEMTKSGFYGDVFNGGFGEFHPMRK